MKLSNHDTNNIKHLKSSSSNATSTSAIESIVCISAHLILGCGYSVFVFFFDQFSHFIFPFSLSDDKCVQIPIVILYEMCSNRHCFDIYVIFNERLFRHFDEEKNRKFRSCSEREKNEVSIKQFSIFNFLPIARSFSRKKTCQPSHTHPRTMYLNKVTDIAKYAFAIEAK